MLECILNFVAPNSNGCWLNKKLSSPILFLIGFKVKTNCIKGCIDPEAGSAELNRKLKTTTTTLLNNMFQQQFIITLLHFNLSMLFHSAFLLVGAICSMNIPFFFHCWIASKPLIPQFINFEKLHLHLQLPVRVEKASTNQIVRSAVWHPGLTSQRHSALISSDSEYFQVCFSAVHYLKISEQRWFSSEQLWKRKFSELKISAVTALFQRWFRAERRWFPLKQPWTALILE